MISAEEGGVRPGDRDSNFNESANNLAAAVASHFDELLQFKNSFLNVCEGRGSLEAPRFFGFVSLPQMEEGTPGYVFKLFWKENLPKFAPSV